MPPGSTHPFRIHKPFLRVLLLSLLTLAALTRNLLLPSGQGRLATTRELTTLTAFESFVTGGGAFTRAGSSIALLTSLEDYEENGLHYRVQYLLPGRRVEVIPASRPFGPGLADRFDTVLLWHSPLPPELAGWRVTRTGQGSVATRP